MTRQTDASCSGLGSNLAVAFAGLLLGCCISYAFPVHFPAAVKSRAVGGAVIGGAKFESAHPLFADRIQRLRTKETRSPADRIDILTTIDDWMARDPVDCINSLDNAGLLSLLTDDAIEAAVASTCKGDAASQIQFGLALKNSVLRDRVVSSAFRIAVASKPAEALELFENLPIHLKSSFAAKLGEALGKNVNKEMIGSLLEHRNSNFVILSEAVRSWAKVTTTETLAFLETAGDGVLRRKQLSKSELLYKIGAEGEPSAVLEFVKRQPVSEASERARVTALGHILASEPSRWAELTSGILSESTKVDIASAAAVGAIRTSPSDALAFLDLIPGGGAREAAARQATLAFLFQNHTRDPKPVLEWLKTVKDPLTAESIRQELRFQKVVLPDSK